MTHQALAVNATNPAVFINNGKAVTTSQSVATYFHKRHDNVLRTLANLECSAEFSALNFEEAEYIDEQGKSRPMYQMTKDGFVFLVMGFTGKKAAAFKEAYIAEFNRMENKLSRTAAPEQASVNFYTIRLSDEELCSLCWLWKIAETMRQDAREMYPALRELGSKFSGICYDMGHETTYTLKNVQQALSREVKILEPQMRMTPKWRNTLPQLHQLKH